MNAPDLIWLIVGVRARRRASFTIGLHASNLEAPNARYVSVLSRFSLSQKYTVRKDTRSQGIDQWYALEFLQNVGERNGYTRERVTAEHSNNRNWARGSISSVTFTKRRIDALYSKGRQKGRMPIAKCAPTIEMGILHIKRLMKTERNYSTSQKQLG